MIFIFLANGTNKWEQYEASAIIGKVCDIYVNLCINNWNRGQG